MAPTDLKLYQIGTFAAGNRLLDPDDRSVQADPGRANSITSGHRACQGCGEALGARFVLDAAMRAAGGEIVIANATGCLEVFSTPYPESAWQLAWVHSLFGNVAAVATGIAAALKAQGREHVRVVAQAGDGGTVDIGLGCLSGMFERNDDVLFVCYDNQGYMNTGVQRSGATPPGCPHRQHQAGRRPSRATSSARARTCPGSPWPTRSPTSRRPPWPTCATSSGRWRRRCRCAVRATCTCWCRARWAGRRPPRTPSAWPASPRRAGCSRCSRPSTGWSRPRRRSASACRSRTTSRSRAASPTSSARDGRPDVVAADPGRRGPQHRQVRPRRPSPERREP